MAKFSWPKQYAMRLNTSGKNERTLAYFNIINEDTGIEFRDVRLIEGKEGMFAAPPFRSYEDTKTKETKYADYWRAAFDDDTNARREDGVAFMEAMTQFAVKKYQELLAGAEDEQPTRSTRQSAPAGRRSGRGPAPTVGAEATSGKRALPF